MDEFSSGILVFDLETDILAPTEYGQANPNWPSNKIVLATSKSLIDNEDEDEVIETFQYDPVQMLVGHNIKFDLIHAERSVDDPDVGNQVRFGSKSILSHIADDNVRIWDTQIAEYILSGQQAKYASLDDLSKQYGLPLKPDKIKKYWDAGVNTSDIPIEELQEYAAHDVEVTRKIALEQMKRAEATGQTRLILSSGLASAALASASKNGMYVDMDELDRQKSGTEELLATLRESLIMLAKSEGAPIDFNVSSPLQIKALLFGGDVPHETIVHTGFTKAGKPKTKREIQRITLPGLVEGLGYPETTDHDNLAKILMDTRLSSKARGAITTLMNFRKMSKLYDTYLTRIPAQVFPDGKLHGNIDQVLTPTGRANSTNPNLQNFPSGDDAILRRIFTSRWGGGYIVEVDFKQLEVVALAHLCKDPRLIDDLCSGVDIHSAVGSKVFGESMTKEQRRTVKTVVFGLIYGGGANTISSQSGVPKELVVSIMKAFFHRYPRVELWQHENIHKVTSSARPSGEVSKTGRPIKVSELRSETGRLYKFFEYDAPSWHGPTATSFSPTEIKNYPVQGLATGDIVPMALGKLWSEIYKDPVLQDSCLVINTVHDSILLDVHPVVIEQALTKIQDTFKNLDRLYFDTFGVPFYLPLNVDIQVGHNWKDTVSIDKWEKP